MHGCVHHMRECGYTYRDQRKPSAVSLQLPPSDTGPLLLAAEYTELAKLKLPRSLLASLLTIKAWILQMCTSVPGSPWVLLLWTQGFLAALYSLNWLSRRRGVFFFQERLNAVNGSVLMFLSSINSIFFNFSMEIYIYQKKFGHKPIY